MPVNEVNEAQTGAPIGSPSNGDFDNREEIVDAVVVGTGLAGLTASLVLLDRGGRVILVDKEPKIGGNSIKASSGINACVPSRPDGSIGQDEIDSFMKDTLTSAGEAANPELVRVLIENSAECLQWLQTRVGVNLTETSLTRLGGHSHARTHRPTKGTIGYSLIVAMQNALKDYEEKGSLKIMVSTRATGLIEQNNSEICWNGAVVPSPATGNGIGGVKAVYVKRSTDKDVGTSDVELLLPARHVVFATGGFAADRGEHSFLAQNAPGYLHMPATFGDFSTGDGISMASSVGAGKIDMDKIQIHPTGFVDPADPSNPAKILCAEVMRGVGGILLNDRGQRFCNELGTRDYVTERMMEQTCVEHHSRHSASTSPLRNQPIFYIVLSCEAAENAKEHIGFYSWKKLLQKYQGIDQLAEALGLDTGTLQNTLEEYKRDAREGKDRWGKSVFPDTFSQLPLLQEEFYAGRVTPVLHYCMGGLAINSVGQVLNEKGETIPGLFAAGEVAGGVHGNNRLAGNSLLECLVFGTIIGKSIPL